MDDMISRQAAIDALYGLCDVICDYSKKQRYVMCGSCKLGLALDKIEDLPSAQPDLDEWCTDCKEYDPKRHSCPRYNKVIREALKDTEPRKTGKWELLPLSIIPPVYKCSACGRHAVWITTGCLVNRHEESYLSDFCPHCGADMRGEQNEKCG